MKWATETPTNITGGPNAGSITYDNRGNMTSDTNGMTFSWDHDGMLTSVTVPDTSPVGIEGTHTYEYDVLGRRVAKTVDDVPNATTTKTTFVQRLVSLPPLGTQGGQVICEYETVDASPTSLARQYTYGSYVDEPLWQHELTTNEQYTLHQDRRYNVVGVTDHANTALLATGNYTGHGQGGLSETAANPSIVLSVASGYTGRRFDFETELWYFRTRQLLSWTGQFIGRDPLEYVNGSSRYSAYFAPEATDPTGQLPTVIAGALAGCGSAAVGAGITSFIISWWRGNTIAESAASAGCSALGACVTGALIGAATGMALPPPVITAIGCIGGVIGGAISGACNTARKPCPKATLPCSMIGAGIAGCLSGIIAGTEQSSLLDGVLGSNMSAFSEVCIEMV